MKCISFPHTSEFLLFIKVTAFKSCAFWLQSPWIHSPCLPTLAYIRITQGAVSGFWPYHSELQSQRIWEGHPGIGIFRLNQGLQFEKYFSTLDSLQKSSAKMELSVSLMHWETIYKLRKEIIPRPIFLKIGVDLAFWSLYEDQKSLFLHPFSMGLWFFFFFFCQRWLLKKKKKNVWVGWGGLPGTVNEEPQDAISTSCFHWSEWLPTYFKIFHAFYWETVYYF